MNCSDGDSGVGRREFLQAATFAGLSFLFPESFVDPLIGTKLEVYERIGTLGEQVDKTPIAGASWFTAEALGDGLAYRFPVGFLQGTKYLTSDLLVDGNDLLIFSITLQEGEHGRMFQLVFGALPQCSARIRAALDIVDQHRWMLDREGATLKPWCGGDLVELAKVDRATFTVQSKHPEGVRWCMTPLLATRGAVEEIAQPVLPKGKLIDEFGQSTIRNWPSKAHSVHDVETRIRSQWQNAAKQSWPESFSRWGGCKWKKLADGKRFFRTHNDGKRWWLVDPDGYAFWSTGLDCVTVNQTTAGYDGLKSALTWLPDPEGDFREIYTRIQDTEDRGKSHINYLIANLIRALGPDGWRDRWAKMTLAEMKRLRFNTVANWSEWEYAKAGGFPYVRPMKFEAKQSGWVYREFPDVYHPKFEVDAADFASILSSSADDPAFIGYFLMNEPTWGGFSSDSPAAGMLHSTESCYTRTELCRFLKKKYLEDTQLAAKWKMPFTFAQLESGKTRDKLTNEAQDDLHEFSALMVERFFSLISSACRKVAPNHLNLGVRYNDIPPAWAVSGMKSFDVFSMNCYWKMVPHAAFEQIHSMLKMPIIVGEFGYGALDVGLPGTGPAPSLKNQLDRGRAYSAFLEDAAADPHCVGAHWFQTYDQSALGRPDGECYNLGFIDVCNRPYAELGKAAIESHERMYQVADGRAEPFRNAPEYLPEVSM